MPIKILPPVALRHFLLCVTLVLSLTVMPAGAQPQTPEYITLDGQVYHLLLTKRDLSGYGVPDLDPAHRFYRIQLEGEPDSEGRLALIEGQWQGMILHRGAVHVLNDSDLLARNRSTSTLQTRALSPQLNLGQCARSRSLIAHPLTSTAVTPRSLNAMALSVDYDNFCQEQVDGVCLVAELTMVFDTPFNAAFGASYRAQGLLIIEYVDLIYRRNFGIAFNQLRVEFGAGDVFDTDIDSVLQTMADYRWDQTIGFDPNPYAIMHYVTGGDYTTNDSQAIGVANFPFYSGTADNPVLEEPVLCQRAAAVGTSQLWGSGSNRTSYTALIVAHEIGHNFGFDHDGQDGSIAQSCSATDWIMGANLNVQADDFSSCSETQLRPNINALDSIENCFDFPADGAIQADAGNLSEGEAGEPITLAYAVTAETRSDQTAGLQVQGNISDGSGRLTAVTLDAAACTLSNSNQSYTCTVSAASTHNLQVSLTAETSVALVNSVTVTGANRYDVSPDNNSATSTISLPLPERTNFERGGESGDGGGGGSLPWWFLAPAGLLWWRRT